MKPEGWAIRRQDVLERLKDLANRLGRTPTHLERNAAHLFDYTLQVAFGSIQNAVEVAGLNYRAPGTNVMPHPHYGRPMRANLEGHKFGKLTVLHFLRTKFSGDRAEAIWQCSCECGGSKQASTKALRDRYGYRSCGCVRRARIEERAARKARIAARFHDRNYRRSQLILRIQELARMLGHTPTEAEMDTADIPRMAVRAYLGGTSAAQGAAGLPMRRQGNFLTPGEGFVSLQYSARCLAAKAHDLDSWTHITNAP